MKRRLALVFAVILFSISLIFSADRASAQADSAQLAGTVVDATGAVVAGASVKVHNVNTGFERSVQSSSSGAYQLSGLPVGTYDVTVAFSGFGNFKTQITLNVGASSTVEAKLGASASQTVEVVAADESTQVNLTTQETSTVISTQELVNLPSLTRNPYDFVVLSGAVASDPNGSTARGVGVSLNGQRAASTEILLDGVENVDSFVAGIGTTIPLDSVGEYRIIVNGFDAQYGRASGGIVNLVTKTGTNHIHGSLYEFNRVSALAANTYNEDALFKAGLSTVAKPDHFTENQFGYSIGGPILKDKLFLFSNTEWNRVRSSGSQQFEIPTPAFLASSSATTKAFFAAYGTLAPGTVVNGTSGDTTGLETVTVTAPINAGAGSPVNQWESLNRIDYSPTGKMSMFFRSAIYKDVFSVGTNSLSPYAGFSTGSNDFNQAYLFSLDYVITPSLLSSSKVSYSRLNTLQPLGSAGVAPSLYLFTGAGYDGNNLIALPGYLPGSPGNAIPFGGPQNEYQFQQDVTYNWHKHTFKVGGQFTQIRDNRVFGAYENAVESVNRSSSVGVASGLATLSSGNIYSFEVAVNPQGKLPCVYNAAGTLQVTAACSVTLPASSPNFERNNTFNDGDFYIQDQWKLTSRLTVNAGMRWEYYGVQHNHNPNLESNFFLGAGAANQAIGVQTGQVATTPNSPVGGLTAKDLTNFAPRLGFAFDPIGNGKWAIRGGYGISYERNFGNVTYNVIQNPPNYAGVTYTASAGNPVALSTSNLGPFSGSTGTVPLSQPSLRALQANMPTAYTEQYSFTVEHEIHRGDLMSIYYSGASGIHQYAIANLNGYGYGTFVGYPNGITSAAPSYHYDRINPQYGAINYREANGNSHYNAVNVGFKAENLANYGLTATINYTYSHALDDLSSTFSESGGNFNLGYLNPYNPKLDYGNADYDIRHRVVIGSVYEPSFLEFKSNRILHTTVGGLQFAPIAVLRSGSAFTVYDCTNGYNACPRIIGVPGEQFHGSVAGRSVDGNGNPLPNSFNFLPLQPNSANPYTNKQGLSDFSDTLGGYQNQGLDRNQWYGPGNVTFDMGVYKQFKFFSDRYTAQLRGEFYDILNHHNYYPQVGTADYAEVQNPFTGLYNVNVTKGSPGGSAGAGDERRNVQIALKILF